MYSITPRSASTMVSPMPLPTTTSPFTTSTNQYSRSSLGGALRSSQLWVAVPTAVIFSARCLAELLAGVIGPATSISTAVPTDRVPVPLNATDPLRPTLRRSDPHLGHG